LSSGVNGSVLQVTNTNATGGTSARGLAIAVPAGRAPIVVGATAGKATNLNADKLDGIDSTGFVRKTSTTWHEIGAAGQPAFACTVGCPDWQNFGSPYNTAGFLKDALGFVHLKGLVSSRFSSRGEPCHYHAFFILPVGYRPAHTVISSTLHNDQTVRIDVDSSGLVSICGLYAWDYGEWFSFDGIEFLATQ
jgi:hypothetical protein